jgi:hypothetical protein
MVEQDDGDYLCDEHGDNTWETRLEAESVMDIAQGGKGFMLPRIQPQLEINTNTEPSNNPIHEAVQFYWGERCPEHEDGCPVCEAWRQYDNLLANNVFVHVPLGMTFAPPRSLSILDEIKTPVDAEVQKAMMKLILEERND